jgi:hypothetical protein
MPSQLTAEPTGYLATIPVGGEPGQKRQRHDRAGDLAGAYNRVADEFLCALTSVAAPMTLVRTR